ncbi:MAG: TonB-dependent receptor, partial [Alphaproteobacteria bacterium]|nr:TonB-dependent receptor [Alphaproteobacteria bacterium]
MRGAGWGLLICLAAAPALADVETVTVTAAPADPVGNAAFSVARLDGQTLRALDQLDRALEQVPGLSTFRRDSCLSANPTTQGVSLRSIAPSGAGRALVTLDGVPLNDPFGGWVLWCSLPAEDLAGAEIVRGAGAGPYGAGALTGTIALDEASGDGLYAADASGGERGLLRAAGAGGDTIGPVQLFGSAAEERMTGWVPVAPAQRGHADNDVTLDAHDASLRGQWAADARTEIFVRAGAYDEARHSGLVGAASNASGETASLTLVHPEGDGALGWRAQAWLRNSGFSNSSVAIGAGRAATTPSNDEYATPALGWGVNGELRGSQAGFSWASGFDLRATQGETHELFSFTGGQFTMNRVAGGKTLVGGVYIEAAERLSGWIMTAGARADEWQSTAGTLRQNVIATGVVTLDQHFADRRGLLPTMRIGARRDFGEFYLRAAGYEGFRPPTLNELYRPFRQGNNFTLANSALA